MSQQRPGQCLTFLSAAALDAHRVVKMNTTAQQVAVATAAPDLQIGVTHNKATAASQEIGVIINGTAKCVAAGNITKGAYVTATTGGAVIATTTAADRYIGIAAQGAASGDVFEVMIMPGVLPDG